MDVKFTILGCGNSTGVPSAGNHWGKCDPAEPKNQRTRCCALIETNGKTFVIDTGPDFRQQMNRANVKHIDAVLYTHAHSDHMNGIDDLRGYVFRQSHKMPVYASAETFLDLGGYFPYMFHGGKIDLYPQLLTQHTITEFCKALIFPGDVPIIPLELNHFSCTSTGYRIGSLAYCVDMVGLDAKAIESLRGIEIWIVDAAGYHQTDNKVHANLETIYKLNAQIGARRVILTSLSLAMDYKTLVSELPEGYEPAYDGMPLFGNT